MRIEIIRPTDQLERERYEFIVRVDSLAVRLNFTAFKKERKESARHRTWYVYEQWSIHDDRYKDNRRLVKTVKPKVPIETYREALRHVNKAISADFVIDHTTPGVPSGVRN